MPVHHTLTTSDDAHLLFSDPGTVTLPAAWDIGGTIKIPLRLRTYSLPNMKGQINDTIILPTFEEPTNRGGHALSQGATEIPKCRMEGYIDTPFTVSGSTLTSSISYAATQITGAQLIQLYLEGEFSNKRPIEFVDPYGRVYIAPTILEFTATYVEQAPFRSNFTMMLALRPNTVPADIAFVEDEIANPVGEVILEANPMLYWTLDPTDLSINHVNTEEGQT